MVFFDGSLWRFHWHERQPEPDAHSISVAIDVTTYHYDNLRTGQNLNETTLTTVNVNQSKFGKLGELMVDGKVDAAAPLLVECFHYRRWYEERSLRRDGAWEPFTRLTLGQRQPAPRQTVVADFDATVGRGT